MWLVEAAVAVPESGTFAGEPEALLAIVKVPVSVAAAFGSKITV